MEIVINANALRAVTPFISKKDIREYLTGLHIRGDGIIEASNGHAAAQFSKAWMGLDIQNMLIAAPFKIPASAETVRVCMTSKQIRYTNRLEETISIEVFRVIEGHYPNLDRVMSHTEEKLSEIAFDVRLFELLIKATKHLPFGGCRLCLSGALSPVKVRHPDMPDWRAAVMPCRL